MRPAWWEGVLLALAAGVLRTWPECLLRGLAAVVPGIEYDAADSADEALGKGWLLW